VEVATGGAAKSAALGATDGAALMAALCAVEGGTPGPAGIKDDGGADSAAMVLIVQRELMRSVLLTSKTMVMAAMI
jgi:hypothetical protein